MKTLILLSRRKKLALIFAAIILIGGLTLFGINLLINRGMIFPLNKQVGEKIDEFNGVAVYYNGPVDNTSGRNQTVDGYNIGLKYQCVEFVKRYYLEHLNHRMPDSYGHAFQFFDNKIKNGQLNPSRNLIQYTNGQGNLPQVNDLIVFSPSTYNPYGHVAIVSKANKSFIEVVQQNMGPFGSSRAKFNIALENNRYMVANNSVLGWLHKNID